MTEFLEKYLAKLTFSQLEDPIKRILNCLTSSHDLIKFESLIKRRNLNHTLEHIKHYDNEMPKQWAQGFADGNKGTKKIIDEVNLGIRPQPEGSPPLKKCQRV